MIITIAGNEGSGKSTVAKLISNKMGYKHYSIGDLRRKMAKEKGMTLEEYNKLGEREEFTDKDVDEYQKKLGETEDNLVVEGRVSFHFIPHSIKVFIKADLDERARRIYKDDHENRQHEGHKDHFKSLEGVKNWLVQREKTDTFRYKKYYNLNHLDPKHFDFVVDSTHIPAEKVAEKIMEFLKK